MFKDLSLLLKLYIAVNLYNQVLIKFLLAALKNFPFSKPLCEAPQKLLNVKLAFFHYLPAVCDRT